jgi:hypothetical protein
VGCGQEHTASYPGAGGPPGGELWSFNGRYLSISSCNTIPYHSNFTPPNPAGQQVPVDEHATLRMCCLCDLGLQLGSEPPLPNLAPISLLLLTLPKPFLQVPDDENATLRMRCLCDLGLQLGSPIVACELGTDTCPPSLTRRCCHAFCSALAIWAPGMPHSGWPGHAFLCIDVDPM